MDPSPRPLAIVTGASSGIGFELARQCAAHGFDLVVAADEPAIRQAAGEFRALGGAAEAVEADLATPAGVDALVAALGGRPVEILMANAGHGLGHAFLDQDYAAVRHVVDTNLVGTLTLVQRIGRDMRARRRGHILITGSLVGSIPGTYHAVYNGTKAFLNSFSFALRHELEGDGVTVTCLMPGATETKAYERAGLLDTIIGQSPKDDAATVAQAGFEAMMRGDGEVVTGWLNKVLAGLARVTPAGVLAAVHGAVAAPRGDAES